MQQPTRFRFGFGSIDGYASDAAYIASVTAPVKVGDSYFNTTSGCYRVCYTITPSPSFNGSVLPTGTTNGSILVWDSGSSSYVEDANILISSNIVTSPLNALVLNVPTIQALDQTLATATTIRGGNSSGNGNNGGDITLSGGNGGTGGLRGNLILKGNTIGFQAISNADPSNPTTPSVYFNGISDKLRIFNGNDWSNVGQGGGVPTVIYWDNSSTTLPSSTPYAPDGTNIINGDTVLFTNLSSGNNEVYQATISGPTISWTLLALGQNFTGVPTTGDSLYITSGTLRHDSLIFYNGSTDEWTVIVGYGANYFLSNLQAPTAVNQNLNPGVTNGSLGLGTATNYWGNSNISTLLDDNGIGSILPFNRLLQDRTNITAVDWNSRYLEDSTGITSADWTNRLLYDPSSVQVLNWANRHLIDSSGKNSVDFNNRYLIDTSAQNSIDWQNRNLIDSSNATQLSWSTAGLTLSQLTASTVPYLNASKVLTSSAVTPTQLGYLSGATGTTGTGNLVFDDAPTFTGNVNMDSFKIINLANGSNPGDAVNYSQLTSIVSGLIWQSPVNDPDLVNDSLSVPPAPQYTFTIASANASVEATYTNNGQTFTVLYTIVAGGATSLVTAGTGAPTASGTLTKASGGGDSSITFSAFTNSPIFSLVYIIGASPSGAWAGCAGHATWWDGNNWIDLSTGSNLTSGLGTAVQVGDRYGVAVASIGGPSQVGGGLAGKTNDIATITNNTPGSIAYSFAIPMDAWAFSDQAPGSQHFNSSYTYSASLGTWIQFSGPSSIIAGNALTFDGNTLNVVYDNVTIGLSANALYVKNNGISNTQLAQMATDTIKGNNTGSTANASDLSTAQVTAMLNPFTSSLQGLTPASGGGAINFLRADGTWDTPSTLDTTLSSTNATFYPFFGSADSGNSLVNTDVNLTYNPSTGAFGIPTVNAGTVNTATVGATTVNASAVNTSTAGIGTANIGTLNTTNGGFSGYANFDELVDGTTTGSNTVLNSASNSVVVVTNASLSSLSTIPAGANGQLLILHNATGNSVTINNLSGSPAANQITTGTSANITMASSASLFLCYDDHSSTWLVIGGSGSGGGFTNPMTSAGDMIYENFTPAPARLPIGSAGQVMTVVGGLPAWNSQSTSAAVPPTETRITTGSGTYTVPSGVLYLRVRMLGGGGGGSAGSSGGNTTLGGTMLVAGGGSGGGGAAGTGPGGAPSGTIPFFGMTGNAGGSGAGTSGAPYPGGQGGAGVFGGNGASGASSGSATYGYAAIANSGAGGGGYTAGPSYAGGGAGAYIEAIITNPASSYSYSVGSGGAGGGGANGGSGVIIIDEFYSAGQGGVSQEVAVSSGATSITISFPSAVANTNYQVFASFVNTVDADPQFQPITITSKTTSGFTATWNAPLESSNYLIDYFAGGNAFVQTDATIAAEYNSVVAGSLAVGTTTFIDFATKETDTNNAVLGAGSGNNTTATSTWRYVAPIAGRYHVDASLAISFGNSNPYDFYVAVYVNGSIVRGGTRVGGNQASPYNGGYVDVTVSTTVKLNAGDYISIVGYQYSTGTQTQTGQAQGNYVCINRTSN